MNRRRSPRPVSVALQPLQDRWAPQTPLAQAQRAWSQAVGDYIAAQAKPVSERGGTLTVACVSGTWANELDLMAPDVIVRLNDPPRSTARDPYQMYCHRLTNPLRKYYSLQGIRPFHRRAENPTLCYCSVYQFPTFRRALPNARYRVVST